MRYTKPSRARFSEFQVNEAYASACKDLVVSPERAAEIFKQYPESDYGRAPFCGCGSPPEVGTKQYIGLRLAVGLHYQE